MEWKWETTDFTNKPERFSITYHFQHSVWTQNDANKLNENNELMNQSIWADLFIQIGQFGNRAELPLIWGAFEIWYSVMMIVEKIHIQMHGVYLHMFRSQFYKKKINEYNCSYATVTSARRQIYCYAKWMYIILFTIHFDRIDIDTCDLYWLKLN